jgi:hypothetical protein
MYIVYRTGVNSILSVFYSVDFFYLTAALMQIPVVVFLKGLKWNWIIKAHGLKYPLKDSCIVSLIGIYLGAITPGRIGDSIRLFYLKKETKTFSGSLSTVIVDRLFDVFSLFILSLVGGVFLIFWFTRDVNIPVITVGIMFSFFSIFIVFFSKERHVKRILKPIYVRFIPEKHKQKMKHNFYDFYENIDRLKIQKTKLFQVALLGILFWLVAIFQGYLLALSLGINVSYIFLLAVLPIVNLIMLIPITISGFGTREISLIFFFSLLNIPAEEAVAFSLLSAVIANWAYVTLGAIVWLKKPIKIEF